MAGACNDADETTVVTKARPTLVTEASADAIVGSAVLTDTATVTGRYAPQASTIDFRLYGPDDATCVGTPVFESLGITYPVAGGIVTSAAFTPTDRGTYRWVATYSGDTTNEAVTGTCGDAAENTVVSLRTPTVVTTASADVTIGAGTLSATASLPDLIGSTPGGTVDFRLYGPDDATCSEPVVFESLGLPAAVGPIPSAAFTPAATGTYRWTVSYSGDDNNAAVTTACDDAEMSTEVLPALPTISIKASPLITLGAGTISATTDIGGRIQPVDGATVIFRLYGPDDDDCSEPPILTTTAVPYPIAGGPITSAEFTPIAAGTYRWQAAYSGVCPHRGLGGGQRHRRGRTPRHRRDHLEDRRHRDHPPRSRGRAAAFVPSERAFQARLNGAARRSCETDGTGSVRR